MYTKRALIYFLVTMALALSAFAQSSSFNYQGRLNDGGSNANGSYQFTFKLYNSAAAGAQVGGTLVDVPVTVSNGIFSVDLDFGAASFTGGDRFLEVSVRKTAGDPYIALTPRQKVGSAPYATRAAVATTADNFSGNLAGEVSGSQAGTVVNSVGGQLASNIASGVQAANNATAANTANTLVKRDAAGKVAVGGVMFGDGTTLTSANVPVVVNGNTAVNAINDAATTGKISTDRLSDNVMKLMPAAPQVFVGDANGTAPMINLRGQSTCCGANTGLADFKVFQNGSFVATGNLGIGTSPMEGKGYRTSWYTYKGAFRSGYADNEWDDANVGFFSWAGGSNSTALGLYSLAFGDTNSAESTSSIVFGSGNQVKGAAGISAGAGNRVCDTYGVAFGNKAQSGGPLINGRCDPDSFNINGLAAVAIGYNVTADKDHSTAMGKFASNNGFAGTFVWSDGSATASVDTFKNTANNEFAARATGGFRFRTNLTGTTGCNLPAGSGVFNCTSSRFTKENFTDETGVLGRLRKIPITSWNYISEGKQVRHLGPMAEDFFDQFKLGTGNASIGVQDLAGVSIAAVKELDAQLQEKDAEIVRLQNEVKTLRANQTDLEKRLDAIEKAVTKQQ
jgi:trimeric autotransporter adhesin